MTQITSVGGDGSRMWSLDSVTSSDKSKHSFHSRKRNIRIKNAFFSAGNGRLSIRGTPANDAIWSRVTYSDDTDNQYEQLLFVQDMSSYDRPGSAGSRRDGALRDAHSPVYRTQTTSSPKHPIKSLSCRIDNKRKSKWWLVATSELGGLAQGCGREKIRSIEWNGGLGVDEVYDTFWVYTHSNTS